MGAPNLFLIYVRDAAASARFYGDLFDMEPAFTSPFFISFDIAGGVSFAVWSGEDADADARAADAGDAPRHEIGLTLPGGAAEIDARFEQWRAKGLQVVSEPHDAVFGRTFVVADPDGHLIRVSPVD